LGDVDVAGLNRVILIGNLTRDPQLRYTPSGTSVANFGIAVNRRRSRQGEQINEVDFFNVVTWGKLAELCSNYITKGSPVALEGRLQSRTWQTEDGQKRTTVEIIAENVQFLGRAGRPTGAEEIQELTEPMETEEPVKSTGTPNENKDEPPF
jgi:single-strand DNA-binding protein